jgi:signal transduction histidine kinase/DNA-binding response OmpR family regulator
MNDQMMSPKDTMAVLVVDDNPGDRDLVSAYLEETRSEYLVSCAPSLTSALDFLSKNDVDVVLLDLGLPDSQGIQTFRRFHETVPDLPIVVMTGLDDDRVGIEAVRRGAQDYLVKGHTAPEVLNRSLRYAVERHGAEAKIKHLNQMLKAIRHVDQLIERERDPAVLIHRVCELLVETRGYGAIWIALGDLGAAPTALAQNGLGDALADVAAQLAKGAWPQCCEIAAAAPSGLALFNPEEACHACPLRRAERPEFEVTVAIRHDNAHFGILKAFLPNALALGDEEQELLVEVAGDIASALHSIELERLREASEVQLAQSDRLASMGMLAAGVAHEINNPLSYILYNLESLAEDFPEALDALNQCQARLVDRFGTEVVNEAMGTAASWSTAVNLPDIQARFRDALRGTRRIRDIAQGLKTFSRVEQDQLEPVHLMDVVEAALNMCSNEIKYRARVVKEYSKTPALMASEGRLSQVFLNLLVNAAHAIDEGDVEGNEIRVRTWVEDQQIIAEVRDTGSGIAPEHMSRLFEPFFTTKAVGAGSGLGLAISRGIIESYGGEITVDSLLGRGTTFQVRLPTGASSTTTPPPPTAVAEPNRARGRVLIVDDEDAIRTAMARMLKEHETVERATGYAARELLEQDQAFDLILCDMMMPQLSGMDLHAWLLETYPRLAQQLVFVTGGAFTPRAREYLEACDNHKLEKPFDVPHFKNIVAHMIREAQHRPA